jgi:hypothetical protein
MESCALSTNVAINVINLQATKTMAAQIKEENSHLPICVEKPRKAPAIRHNGGDWAQGKKG